MGSYLSEPNKQKEVHQGKNEKYEFCAAEMQGWRLNMEDAHIAQLDIDKEHKDTHIFGVFDGHGGREVAKYVSKYFVQELLSSHNYKNNHLAEALKDTFLKMDVMLRKPSNKAEILSYQQKDEQDKQYPNESYAGCTANVILIRGNTLYCANAGDTRGCLSNNGKLVKMSKDHKPDDPLEKARITEAGGYVAEGRVNSNLNLSRALGDLEYKKDANRPPEKQLISAMPDVKIREFAKGDQYIFIGCDGIWETQSSDDIITYINKSLKTQSIKSTAENLLDWLIAPDIQTGAGCDNMSAIIIRLNNT